MKRIEIISGIVLIIGIILNLLLIPNGGFLFTISILVLAFMYFYCGIFYFLDIKFRNWFKRAAYTAISSQRIFGAIATGVSLASFLVGLLFKFHSLPGTFFNIFMGGISLVIILIISLIKYLKTKSSYYSKIIIRITVIAVLSLPLYFFWEQVYIDFKYRNYPDYVEAYKNYRNNPQNDSLQYKFEQESKKIGD